MQPRGIAFDALHNLYVTDFEYNVVYKVWRADATVTVVAGNVTAIGVDNTACNTFPDGVPATQACLTAPMAVAVASDGTIIIADTGSNRIRAVSASTGQIRTIAGSGNASCSATTVPLQACLNGPAGVAIDRMGAVLFTDTGNGAAYRLIGWNSTDAVLVRVAANTSLVHPAGIAADLRNNVLIADTGSNVVLNVSTDGSVAVLFGNASAQSDVPSGDGLPSTQATVPAPGGLYVNNFTGNVLVAQSKLQRGAVRHIDSVSGTCTECLWLCSTQCYFNC
jgi:sugar lactone lactonase YvrE